MNKLCLCVYKADLEPHLEHIRKRKTELLNQMTAERGESR